MKKINVIPTVESIRDLAMVLQRASKDLINVAEKMANEQDITYAAEAMTIYANVILNARLDLIVLRPIRAFEDVIEDIMEEYK